MANNLRKFDNEAAYSAATLNYPAVSWIVSGDTLHYDKGAQINDKIIIVSNGDGSGENHFIFFNCYAPSSGDITSITLDNVEVNPITCQTINSNIDASQVHTAKYSISATSIDDWMGGELGVWVESSPATVDVLLPSQITQINSQPWNLKNLVLEAENPASIEFLISEFGGSGEIYVPDASVNAYKSDPTWGAFAGQIKPISEYSGNLPI